jgi:hypothetical protein
MPEPTLDDAKALVRSLGHRDRMLLIPWLVATFDSTGAGRPPGPPPLGELRPLTQELPMPRGTEHR